MFKFKIKRNKQVYLSELFLKELHGDCSIKSVLAALRKCNNEFLKRLSGEESEYLIDYLFKKSGTLPNYITQELNDFNDVYSEFEYIITPSAKNQFLILQ